MSNQDTNKKHDVVNVGTVSNLCSCGNDAKLLVCEHLFHGLGSGCVSVSWVGTIYCSECACDVGEATPVMHPICKTCARLLFDEVISSCDAATPPYLMKQNRGAALPPTSHKLDELLDGMADQERAARAGIHKWVRTSRRDRAAKVVEVETGGNFKRRKKRLVIVTRPQESTVKNGGKTEQ